MKFAFMFTGQGAQKSGMLRDFYEKYDVVKELFKKANTIYNISFEEVLFKDDERLHQTRYTQPALFLLYTSILEVLKKTKLSTDYSFGLSLGEYGALYHQGVFDFETGFHIILKRSEAMESVSKSGIMAAVLGMDEVELETIINRVDGTVVIANYNTVGQLVISGDEKAVQKVSNIVKNHGAKRVIPLHTSNAFHSPFMSEAKEQFKLDLAPIDLKEPGGKLLLNVTGKPYSNNLKEYMIKQLDHSVLFTSQVRQAIDDGITDFIEIGPKKTLCSFVRKIDCNVKTHCINTVDSMHRVIEQLEVN